MGRNTTKYKNRVVNSFKLVYLPIIVALVSIACVGAITFYTSREFLIGQMKNDGISLAKQASRQVMDNYESVESLNKMLEKDIRIAARLTIEGRENLNDQRLAVIAQQLEVDEIHWLDPSGRVVYSTVEGYKDWEPPADHPLYGFIHSGKSELMEQIRPDWKYKIPVKYGAVKANDGYIVHVGILAKNVEELTKKFGYQDTVERLAKGEGVAYALIVDNSLKTVADADREDIGISYAGDKDLIGAVNGLETVAQFRDDELGIRVFEVAVPLYDEYDENVIGALVIGFSMEQVYAMIYENAIWAMLVAAAMFAVFLKVQGDNITDPAYFLDMNIGRIDIEDNIKYRLPVLNGGTFEGLSALINSILDKTEMYFTQLRENEEELTASNEELSSAFEQLAASEEELRAQYDEIQGYTRKLEDLKKKYEIAIEKTGSAVWEVDISSGEVFVSDEIRNIADVKLHEGQGGDIYRLISDVVCDEDKDILSAEYDRCKNGVSCEMNAKVRVRDINGNSRWILIRGNRIDRAESGKSVISGIVIDITQIKKQEEHIERLAYSDYLTQLPNRTKFMERLENEMLEGKSGAVVLLDMDNFKSINDTMGHAYGDMVLQKSSEILKNIAGEKLFVSRFGGDEFLMLISGEKDRAGVEHYLKVIASRFGNKVNVGGNDIYINFSMGITMYPHDSCDPERLVMNADTAMYSVKNTGKNSYMFFHDDMTRQLKDKAKVEKALRDALDSEGFSVVYQPQVNLKTGFADGYEALIRLKEHRISPAEFIPVAEETGLITQIGKWVTTEVIGQMAKWNDMGFACRTVAINVSTRQLNDDKYAEFLKSVLDEHRIDPAYLELEITESLLLDRTEDNIIILNKLKDIGVKIALDDFGTGYSSLSYLTFIPVDKIKLDKSLNDKFLEHETIKVMDSLISLAHSLNLRVTAEGIETVDQYKRLRIGGCDYIQGYLFSRPQPAEEIEKMYSKNFIEDIAHTL